MKTLDKEKTIDLLNEYRSKDGMRPTLASIFPVKYRRKEWMCASNGHEILMILKNGQNSIPAPEHKTPDVADILPKKWEKVKTPMELLEIPYHSAPIEDVDEQTTCSSCEGSGEFDHDGENYECRKCAETGQMYTGYSKEVRGHDHLVHLDRDPPLDFKLYNRMLAVIRHLSPDSICYLRQKEKRLLHGFMMEDQVLIWMAGMIYVADHHKNLTLPLPV